AIVAVLSQLHHQHTRPAAFGLQERLDLGLDLLELRIVAIGCAIDPGDRAHFRLVPGIDLFQRARYLADGRARAHGRDRKLQQVAGAAGGCLGQSVERGGDLGAVAAGLDPGEARDLLLAHLAVVDVQHVDIGLQAGLVLVDADDDVFAAIDPGLAPRGRLPDAPLA